MKKLFNGLAFRFEKMYQEAYALLLICLNLILFTLCILYIYIDTRSSMEMVELWWSRSYIFDCVCSAFLLSFGGASLLDYASVRDAE